MVVDEAVRVVLVSKVLEWIRPQKVAHQTRGWRLSEAVDLDGSTQQESFSDSAKHTCAEVSQARELAWTLSYLS